MTRERLRPELIVHVLRMQEDTEVYNLHRSPYFWDNPQEFETGSVLRTKKSNGIEGWAGFDPSRIPGAPYPNEGFLQIPLPNSRCRRSIEALNSGETLRILVHSP
ncbi:hypothetical protein Bca4012_020603 [Brassica carinata]